MARGTNEGYNRICFERVSSSRLNSSFREAGGKKNEKGKRKNDKKNPQG